MDEKQRKVKQVIVYRKDLIKNHRIGKFGAQCCHASLGALLKMFNKTKYPDDRTKYCVEFEDDSILDKWLNGIFTKVVLYVDNEEELIKLYEDVTNGNKDIPCVLIEDNGLTEFHGVKTKTCVGIGPFWSDEIDVFTSKLKLL